MNAFTPLKHHAPGAGSKLAPPGECLNRRSFGGASQGQTQGTQYMRQPVTSPALAAVFVHVASAPPRLPPDLLLEVQACPGSLPQLVLRCDQGHPEVCCRGKCLWKIVAVMLADGSVGLELWHRDRQPRVKGWHLHRTTVASYRDVRALISLVYQHDVALYTHAHCATPA